MENPAIIEEIIKILNSSSENKTELIKGVLKKNLIETKIDDIEKLGYCKCGFPISQHIEGKYTIIADLVKHQIDFRSYREFLYCPNCEKLIETIQH